MKFSFIRHFPSVEDGPGGIYLSGQSSDPACCHYFRIDPSSRIGRSFSEFRTCCVGQKCTPSIREGGCAQECAGPCKTRDLGGESTSVKTISLWRRAQIIQGSRLRLFRHNLVRARRGWLDQHAHELNRISQLRRTRRRQMDAIYAREGHTFAVIAGLRLDTTPFDHYTGKWAPRWYAVYRPPRGFDARHPIGL